MIYFDVYTASDQKWQDKVYYGAHNDVSIWKREVTIVTLDELIISSPTHDGNKRKNDAVQPNNADGNYSSPVRHESSPSKAVQRITDAFISIHADGQKGQNRGGHSDEIHCDPRLTRQLSVCPNPVFQEPLDVEWNDEGNRNEI